MLIAQPLHAINKRLSGLMINKDNITVIFVLDFIAIYMKIRCNYVYS